MAGANLKTNAAVAQVGKLEAELKTAFKEGKFETVRKKVEDILKLDPENRLATRILEKVQAEEAEEAKRANASRVKALEAKMDQAFKVGDLPGMSRMMAEIKKLDLNNRKVLGYEAAIEKAKSVLGAEMRREKIQKLAAEVEFFANKADWGGAESKANELLALEWNHPVALRAIGKVAKAKRVRPETLITAKETKVEPKPGFFARLFGKKPKSDAAVSAPKSVVPVPVAKPAVAEVAKSVPEVKPVAKPVVLEVKKPELAKAVLAKVEPTSSKPGFFAGLFAKKPEISKPKEAPKSVVPVPVAKPAVAEVAKPVPEVKPVAKPVVLEVKKPELAKAVLAKVEPTSSKPGFFARLFGKKPKLDMSAVAPKPAALKTLAKPAVAEVAKPAVAEVKPVAKPIVQESKKPEPAKAIPAFNALASMLDTRPAVSTPPKAVPAPTMPMKPEVSILKPVVPAIVPKPMVETKPMAPAAVPATPKPSIFGSLFAKKEEPRGVAPASVAMAKPIMPSSVPQASTPAKVAVALVQAPVAVAAVPMVPKPEVKPIAPTGPMPMASKIPEPQLRVEQKTVAKPETNVPEKGNIFTSLFGKEEAEPTLKPSASVLETIVAKTTPEKNGVKAKKEKVPEENTGEGLLAFASGFLKFAVVFILLSASFLYVENMDAGNNVLGLIKKENNAIQLHNADESLTTKKAELEKVNKEIGKYKGGYQDEHQKAIAKIVANRMDWPAILGKLNEVTESVYAKNAISQYVQYNNYNYDTEKGQLTVSGTLSDPLGKNLTKLAELEDAFRNYPKDPSNPNDDRKPYFFGLSQFNSFVKTLDSATGRYKSTFNLSLSTKETKKK